MVFRWFFNRNKKDRHENKSIKQETQVHQKKVEEKPKVRLFKKKHIHISYVSHTSIIPSGCKYFLGYLHDRPERSSVIPKECVMCKKVLDCLVRAHV